MTPLSAAQAAPAQTRSLWTSKHLPLLIAAGVSLLATAAFFAPVVFEQRIFVERDILRVYYPLHKFWADQVRSGHFPLWYPYDGLGQPYVGMVISGAFHPFNLLFLVLSLGGAMSASVLLCYPLALTGTFLLCRRWEMGLAPALLAGALFAFNGYLIGITNNLPYLMSASAFPLAFWAADRFFSQPSLLACGTAALLLALVLFGGDSQSFAVAATLVIPLGLCSRTRRHLSRTLLLVLGLLALTALFALPQLVSALQVVHAGNPGTRALSDATVWSVSPARIFDLLVGPVWAAHFHSNAGYQSLARSLSSGPFRSLWVDSLFLGVLPVTLAAVGVSSARKRVRTWVLVAVGAILFWLALGSFGGLYPLAFRWIPLWRPFRYPVKLMPYVLFALSVGAGWGLQVCLERERYRKAAGGVIAGCSAALLLVALLPPLRHLLAERILAGGAQSATTLPSLLEAVRVSCLQSGLLGLLAVPALLAPLRAQVRALLVGLTALTALFVANRSVYSTALPEVLTTAPSLLKRVLADPDVGLGRGRVASAANASVMPRSTHLSGAELDSTSNLIAMRADTPALRGVESMEAYLPAVSRALSDMEARHPRWLGAHTDLYSAHYVVVPPGGRIGARQRPLLFSSSAGISLLENLAPTPRAYLAWPRCLASHDEVVAALTAPTFEPKGEALLQCPAPLEWPSTERTASTGPGTVQLTHYAPTRIEADVNARTDSVLVLNDAFYPGWTATVDDQPEPILQANGLVRAVRVPSGTHRVTFTYVPPFFWASCLVALIALALVFIGGGARKWAGVRWPLRDTGVTDFVSSGTQMPQ